MFNPVGVQSQQASGDKAAQAAESVDAAELTLQGEQPSVILMCGKRHSLGSNRCHCGVL